MVIVRGSIHWVDLGPVRDSAPAKRRPVLVVQSDAFTSSRLATVVVCAITSQTQRAELPGHVFLPASASGLAKDSVIAATQIVTLDKASLSDSVAQLPSYLIADVEEGLRTVLALR